MSRRLVVTSVLAAVVLGGIALAIGFPSGASPSGAPVAVASTIPSPSTPPTVRPSMMPSSPSSPRPSPSPSPSTSPSPSPIPSPEPVPGASRPSDTAVFESVIDRARKRYAIPGLAATVIWPDGSTWTGVAGWADLVRKRAVTADTVFTAASISKTFTAALVLSLVSDGRLSLDDPVHQLLPGLSTRKVPTGVTVRMLLDHTSGIYDYFLNPKINAALLGDRDRAWTTANAMRYVGKPYFKPGREWRYSNTNYLLLGMIVERLTGRSVAAELHARFIDPLDLDHTTIQGFEPAAGPTTKSYRFATGSAKAKPIGLDDGSGIVPYTSVVTAAAAAGSVASTSDDLARWARALYGGDVLDDDMLDLMLASVDATARFKPRVPYGYGVQRVKVAGHLAYGHSGRFLGGRALMRYLPDIGLAVVVVANTNRTNLDPILANLVKAAVPSPEPSPSPVPSAAPSTVPPG